MQTNQQLETTPILKLLRIFAMPSVISMVLNAIYNMVDQIFIGQGVGYLGNGATNVIFPLTVFAIAFSYMAGDGASSYMNLKMGEKKQEDAKKGMAAGILLSLGIGLFLLVLYNLFLTPLSIFFGATDAILPYALDYGRIISLGMVFYVFPNTTMSIIRADGSPSIAMGGMIAGCVVNMIGDPLTIFVFHMGVKGAALATIMGQFVTCLINIWYLSRHGKSIQLEKKDFYHCSSYFPSILKMGLSSFVTQITIVIVLFVQNNVLVKYGAQSRYGAEIPMTALGVTMKVFTILQSAIIGLTTGSQPIFSYNYGARNYLRVKTCLKYTLCIAIGLFALATAIFQISPMSIVSWFGSNDPLYNEFSVLTLRLYLSCLVFDAFQMVGSSYLQSIGKAELGSILILFRQVIIQIPSMLILAAFGGVEATLYAGPISSVSVGLLSIFFITKQVKTMKSKEYQQKTIQA